MVVEMSDIDRAFRQHQEKQCKYNIQRSPAGWCSVECRGLIVPPFMMRYRQLWWKHQQLLLNTGWKKSGVKWIPLKIPRLWCLQEKTNSQLEWFLCLLLQTLSRLRFKQLNFSHGRTAVAPSMFSVCAGCCWVGCCCNWTAGFRTSLRLKVADEKPGAALESFSTFWDWWIFPSRRKHLFVF